MPVIHFLNVKEGDCSIIQHYSGNVSVVDVCNAKIESAIVKAAAAHVQRLAEDGILGNFNQKSHSVNPIRYMQDRAISSVFRFILTHADMDHMGGLRDFFETFRPLNFWDTDNNVEKDGFGEGCPYDEDDWLFYKDLRDGNPSSCPKRLTLLSGVTGKYFNEDDSSGGGDGLHILAPTAELIAAANASDDSNDASYVLLYKTDKHRIVFGGDSHDATWEHILSAHGGDVADVDLLIAPHHGRASGRSYEFLDVLKPRLTFFGNANSEHLAYGAWNRRNLPFITNNQAGCMIVRTEPGKMHLYVTHKPFAEEMNRGTCFVDDVQAYYCACF